ncbi:Ribosomal RNA large subunit methyltransferase H [bioreactor metagenome]|uniref:Ribosomal RNA large subunit methyltransferase H n=1 Tax=bioreactor metagenome TaxID=1076179 RepID=A0A645ASD6_9ZZZZ|nr:23S rRNA (pseudouridine(1915)-N(3))-methyltransferase RlmH [Erysipelotrichaceae bacterium]
MIRLIAVGKVREKALQELINEYLKRLSGYTKLQIVEVSDEAVPDTNSELLNKKALEAEGKRLLAAIREKDYVILLDLHGEMPNSIQLSQKLDKIMTYQSSNLVFVIGGSLGVADEVIKRADYRWKLSDLTFPHQLTRLLVLEQLYRSYKIANHETYHK